MKKEDKLYQELIEITEYIAEKRKLGWLLIDENNDIVNAEFVYETPFNNKCISLRYNENYYGSIVVYGETSISGESTLIKEYNSAKKYLKTYKLFEPKKIHKL
jgi:hypothetical protein